MDKLTNYEQKVFDYIVSFKTINGYSPTIREIADGIETSAIWYIKETLEVLADKGYIRYKQKSPRTIVVLKFE